MKNLEDAGLVSKERQGTWMISSQALNGDSPRAIIMLALGTILAFMMSVNALSLPKGIILRKALKPRLIAVFIGVVGIGIICTGYLFNYVVG